MAKILNYTTEVPVEKTASQIQKMLAEAGAQAVMVEYDQAGQPVGLSFRIDFMGEVMHFRPPVKVDAVYAVLSRGKRMQRNSEKPMRAQAARVAWRIIKDLTEAQLAVRKTGQADFPELFLQYLQNDQGQTLYERMKVSKFKMLEAPKGE